MNRLVIVLLLSSGIVAQAQVDVLTANYNNHRTSANLDEWILSPDTVAPGLFGKLATLPVTGQIYAQPLLASNLNVPACGTCDVLIIATMENNVYAFNATTLSPTPLWQVNLGPAVPSAVVNFRDIDPSIGILSTPAIDRSQGAIYLVAETLRVGKPVFRLHALDLTNGQEILNGPIDITATVRGTGDDNVNGKIALDSAQHLQRPGLLTANGRVYFAFGSIYDREPYHGWVVSHNATDLRQQMEVLNTTPDGLTGGIWQSGRGIVADSAGNLYLGAGNGSYDGLTNFGESFLRCSPSLQVVDWFTPFDFEHRSDVDLDTASLGPILIPSLDLILGGDKDSHAYLIDRWNMGHLGVAGISTPQIFPSVQYGGLFNSAVWDRSDGPLAYFVDEGTATVTWHIDPATKRFDPAPSSSTAVNSDYPWQGIAVSAFGDYGGILWMTAGDHSFEDVPGTLYAFDANDLTNLLWTSETNPDSDRLGGFAKFATPTVANGLVFVPTFSNQVAVYGLLGTGTNPMSKSNKRSMY